MGNLGNLHFSVLYKDDPKQLEAIKKKALKELEDLKIDTKIIGAINKRELLNSIKGALSGEKFKVDIVVDKAKTSKIVRDALRNAGLDRNFSASDLRAARAASVTARAEAYVASQRELARQRTARASKAELDLENARMRNAAAIQRQAASYSRMNSLLGNQLGIVGGLRNELANLYSVYTIQNFVRQVIEVGGEFEKQRLALGAILNDAGQAEAIFSKIKSLAVVSPFGVKELSDYSKQLAAYNIPYHELFETTKRLADISAGVGVDMSRIILAYGQVRSAQFLRGAELRQFTEAGIPMVQALADKFSVLEGRVVSAGEVIDMITKKKVTFGDVKDVLWEMTGEGGMFNNMQETLSESLSGKWSNLKDAYDIMLSEMAESNNSILKKGIEGLTVLMGGWQDLLPVLLSMISAYGVYRIALVTNNQLIGNEYALTVKSVLAAKEKEAANLSVAASYRTLTAAEKGVIATKGKLSTANWMALASSGALTKEQALQLVALKRLKSGQIGHIARVLGISKAEIRAAMSTNKWNVAMLRLTVNLKRIGAALKGMVLNPYMAIFAGISLIAELYSKWERKNEEMEENIQSLSQKANDGYKNIASQLKKLGEVKVGAVNADELMASIKEIEEALKNYSPRSGDILREATAIEDVAKRYAYLREELETTGEAYRLLNGISNVAEWANSQDSVDGVFDDSLRENVSDYIEKVNEANKALMNASKHHLEISDAINKVASRHREFQDAISGKSVQEQIRLLPKYGDAWYDVWRILNMGRKHNVITSLTQFAMASTEVSDVLEKDVMPDLERFSDLMKNQLESEGFDFSNLSKEQEDALRMAVNDFLNKVPGITQEIQDKLSNEVLVVRWKLEPAGDEFTGGTHLSTYAEQLKNVTGGKLFSDKELESVTSLQKAYELLEKTIKGLEEEHVVLSKRTMVGLTPEQAKVARAELEKNTKDLEDYKSAAKLMFEQFGEDKNTSASTKDSVAEYWRERISLIDKALASYKDWKELVGEYEAKRKVSANGTFAKIFSDANLKGVLDDPDKVWNHIRSQLGKTARQQEIYIDLGMRIDKGQMESFKKDLERKLEEVNRYISDTTKKWDLFKSVKEATGNKEWAMKVVFGGDLSFDSILDDLKSRIQSEIESSSRVDVDLANLLSMDTNTIKREYGEALSELVGEYQEQSDKINSETLKNAADLLNTYKTFEQKRLEIVAKTERDIADLKKHGATDEIVHKRKKHGDEQLASLGFEEFKGGDLWAKTFEDLGNLSSRTIDLLLRKLEEFKVAAGKDLPVNDFKELMKTLHKLRGESESRNPFKSIVRGVKEAKAAINEYKIAQERLKQALAQEEAIANGAQIAVGIGGEESHTETRKAGPLEYEAKAVDKLIPKYKKLSDAQEEVAEAEEEVATVADKIKKAFSAVAGGAEFIADGFSSAASACSDLSSMFSSLGDEKASDMLGTISGVLSGAGGIAKSVASFASGDIMGGISSAVSGVTGIISSIAQAHDKKLDRAIERSKLKAKQLSNIYSQIESSLEQFLGSGVEFRPISLDEDIATIREADQKIASLQARMDAIQKKGPLTWVDLYALQQYSKEIDKISKESEKERARLKAYEEGGAFGYQRELLKQQKAEVETQLQKELGKKDVNQDAVEDYKQQIAELGNQIKNFSAEMANSLYGIDFKGWASQLGDALVEAFEKGEDAGKAFERTVGDIMRDLAKDILVTDMIEKSFREMQKYLFGDNGEGGVFGKDFVLDSKEIEGLKPYFDAIKGTIPSIEEFYKAIGKAFPESNQSDKEDSEGLSAGIKGVTEDTGNLLASYINAIRADVSLQREFMRRLVDEAFPRYSLLAEAQLKQLAIIADNTGRNANLVEQILGILNSNVNGVKPWNVA